MKQPVNIVGGFYRDDSLPWSAQDCVNWLPVPAERPGTRTPSKLRTPPGLRPLVEIGASPIRGMENVEGALYVVSGTTLYRISTAGVAIPMGTIPGVGPVAMSYNQQGIGNQLLVTNGSSSGYVLNTATDTLAPITDDGYPGAISTDYIDSYLVQVEPFGRYWFWSNLADATDYNTLDRAEAEASPDRIVGLAVNQFEVVIFGQRTIEFFWNTGAATGTFQSKRVMANRGCASGRTIAKLGDALVWLGDDGIVYTLAGYQAVPLSTRPINDAIAGFNWAQAFAFVWEDRGHQVYYLTFPDGLTFGFDAASKEWHRRASFDMDRWRPNAVAKWNGQWVAGDFQAGRLYALDWDYMLDGADPIVAERVTGVLAAAQDPVGIPEAEFLFDTGRGHETAPVAFPEQPDGPSISGEAPDGLSSDAYSFAYTTTAGDAPIARTVLRGTTLPEGWAWDESTATISHAGTPVPTGTISLSMRVYDTNGLYADHTDEFMVVQEYQLLVTGSAKTAGGPMYASAVALDPLSFEGISQSSGADLAGIPASYGGVTVVAGNKDARVSTDLTTWATIPNALNALRGLVGGPGGWLFTGDGGDDAFDRTGIAAHPPTAFESYRFASEYPPGTPLREHGEEIYDSAYSGGYYWMDSGSRGELIKTPVLSGSPLQAVCNRPNGISNFFDIVEWGGDLYATCLQLPGNVLQLRRSTDGGATWPDLLLTEASPFQMACNDDVLVCLSSIGQWLWTSEDNFSTQRSTGVNTPTVATGRQIVAAAGRFYIIGRVGLDNNNCVCISTVDGITFSDPVSLPISAVRGIAAGVVE